MGLEAFKTEEKEEKNIWHDNDKLDKEKLWNPVLCPDCGEEGEHQRGSEYRCKGDNCETITWRSTKAGRQRYQQRKQNA